MRSGGRVGTSEENGMDGRKLIQVLWPAFVVAGAAEALFFTIFDPHELYMFGEPVEASRTAIYSVGFFAFWLVAAASSAPMREDSRASMSLAARSTSAATCSPEPSRRSLRTKYSAAALSTPNSAMTQAMTGIAMRAEMVRNMSVRGLLAGCG